MWNTLSDTLYNIETNNWKPLFFRFYYLEFVMNSLWIFFSCIVILTLKKFLLIGRTLNILENIRFK